MVILFNVWQKKTASHYEIDSAGKTIVIQQVRPYNLLVNYELLITSGQEDWVCNMSKNCGLSRR